MEKHSSVLHIYVQLELHRQFDNEGRISKNCTTLQINSSVTSGVQAAIKADRPPLTCVSGGTPLLLRGLWGSSSHRTSGKGVFLPNYILM